MLARVGLPFCSIALQPSTWLSYHSLCISVICSAAFLPALPLSLYSALLFSVLFFFFSSLAHLQLFSLSADHLLCASSSEIYWSRLLLVRPSYVITHKGVIIFIKFTSVPQTIQSSPTLPPCLMTYACAAFSTDDDDGNLYAEFLTLSFNLRLSRSLCPSLRLRVRVSVPVSVSVPVPVPASASTSAPTSVSVSAGSLVLRELWRQLRLLYILYIYMSIWQLLAVSGRHVSAFLVSIVWTIDWTVCCDRRAADNVNVPTSNTIILF